MMREIAKASMSCNTLFLLTFSALFPFLYPLLTVKSAQISFDFTLIFNSQYAVTFFVVFFHFYLLYLLY